MRRRACCMSAAQEQTTMVSCWDAFLGGWEDAGEGKLDFAAWLSKDATGADRTETAWETRSLRWSGTLYCSALEWLARHPASCLKQHQEGVHECARAVLGSWGRASLLLGSTSFLVSPARDCEGSKLIV